MDAAAEEEERKKIAAMKKGRRGSVSSESVRNADAGSMKFPVHDKVIRGGQPTPSCGHPCTVTDVQYLNL